MLSKDAGCSTAAYSRRCRNTTKSIAREALSLDSVLEEIPELLSGK
jgi:hypothetical protein